MQLCWTLFGVISGLLYFKEYVGMSGLQIAMFVLGVVVVCMGAAMLAYASQGDMAALHRADTTQWPPAGKIAHAHAPVAELQVVQDSSDFKLQVVWSGTDSDKVLVAHCEYQTSIRESVLQHVCLQCARSSAQRAMQSIWSSGLLMMQK
jgi:hypothetical protein